MTDHENLHAPEYEAAELGAASGTRMKIPSHVRFNKDCLVDFTEWLVEEISRVNSRIELLERKRRRFEDIRVDVRYAVRTGDMDDLRKDDVLGLYQQFLAGKKAYPIEVKSQRLTQTDMATSLICDLLASGPKLSADVFAAAIKAGLSQKTVERAVRLAKDKGLVRGYKKHGQKGRWWLESTKQ